MKRRKIALIIGIVLAGSTCFMPARPFADIIYLKNGKVLEGEIVERTDGSQAEGYMEVRLKSAKVRLRMSEVKSIEKKQLPEGFFEQPAEPAETPVRPEAKPAPEQKPSYKISISAVYNNDFGKEIIIVSGKTNLPDKSPIEILLKTKDDLLAGRQTLVKSKQFYISFGPFGQRLNPGSYLIEAECKTAGKETVKGSYTIPIGIK